MLEENNKIVFGEEYENQEFGLIDEDDYEIVLKAEIRETKDKSKDYLNLDFKIREEVDQNFKGRHVFEALWRDKHNPEIFDFNKLNKIILTQENPKLQFGEMDEVIQYINGLCFRIKIKTIFDEYTGKEKNVVEPYSYSASQVKETTSRNLESISLPDDDLPF